MGADKPRPLLQNSLVQDPNILADMLTLSQPGGADSTHHITTSTPRFADLPMALICQLITEHTYVLHLIKYYTI